MNGKIDKTEFFIKFTPTNLEDDSKKIIKRKANK